MQTASYIGDRLDTQSLGTPLVAMLVSVLAHGLLLWMLQGDIGVPVKQARQAGAIMVRLAHSAPTTEADVAQSSESEIEEMAQIADTSSVTAADAPEQAITDAAPQPVAAKQQAGQTAALEPSQAVLPARREQPPFTVVERRATERHKPKAAVVHVTRAPARSVRQRPAVQRQPTAAKTLARMDTRPALSVGSKRVPVSTAGFSVTPIYAPEPVYPLLARRLGLEGVVTLRISIAAGGVADSIEVLASSGHTIFDRAAMDAVRNWRFQVSGVQEFPAASSIDVPIRFQLN